MTKSGSNELHARAQADSCDLGSDEFECLEKRCKRNFRRCVLITNYNHRFTLRHTQPLQFEAVSNKAHIAFIRVSKVHGPIFGLLAVVAEGPCDFKLKGPAIWDQQVRRPLGTDRLLIGGQGIRWRATATRSWGSPYGPTPGRNCLNGMPQASIAIRAEPTSHTT